MMSTVGTSNGFFSRLKNVFSSSASTMHAEENHNETATLENVFGEESNTEEIIAVNEGMNGSRYNSNESVTEKEITLRRVDVSAPNPVLPGQKDLDIRFATKFVEAGGRFIFCESVKDAIDILKDLKSEKRWAHVFCWENEIKDAFIDNNFQKGAIGFTIENSEAAVSLCETLIADEGTIILNPKQASRRRLSCFPKTHIIFTDIAHLAGSEADGLAKFYRLHKGELPSIIKLGACNNGHFYDKTRLILNAEGPEDVYIFLIDELIPPSLRP